MWLSEKFNQKGLRNFKGLGGKVCVGAAAGPQGRQIRHAQ